MPPLLSRTDIPFLRFLLPLAYGIFLQEKFDLSFLNAIFIIFGTSTITLSYLPTSPYLRYRYRSLFGIGISCLFLSLGIWRTENRQTKSPLIEPNLYQVVLSIKNEPIEKKRSFQAYSQLISARDTSAILSAYSHPILLYLPKDSLSRQIKSGDMLIGNGRISRISNGGNPHEFNFKEFMQRKGVYYSLYLSEYTLNGQLETSSLREKAIKVRKHLIKILQAQINDPASAGFLSAIMLGYKQDLEPEIREDFSRTGLSHILAVSGLHTGIILLVLSCFLWPIRLFGFYKASYAIILSCMWGYAFITGLPASVVRAVCMISVLLIGKIISEKSHSMNALFITAFFMLLYDPFYLFDIGFQLSFTAVLSILIFNPLLRQYFPVKWGWLRPVSDIIFVSISAQILTLPLSLYYFHIFPIWFLPANLIVIPLLTPYMLLSILVIGLGLGGINLTWLTWLVTRATHFILGVSDFFRNISGNNTNWYLFPDMIELFLIWCLIGTLSFYLINKKAYLLISFLTLVCISLGYEALQTKEEPHEMIIFNQRENNTIHFFNNHSHLLYSPDSSLNLPEIKKIYAPYTFIHKIEEPHTILHDTIWPQQIIIREPFLQKEGKTMCMITTNAWRRHTSDVKPKIDYLILGSKFSGNLHELKQLVQFKQVILTPTLSFYTRQRILKEADSTHIEVWDISTQGAFRLPLTPLNLKNQLPDVNLSDVRSDN